MVLIGSNEPHSASGNGFRPRGSRGDPTLENSMHNTANPPARAESAARRPPRLRVAVCIGRRGLRAARRAGSGRDRGDGAKIEETCATYRDGWTRLPERGAEEQGLPRWAEAGAGMPRRGLILPRRFGGSDSARHYGSPNISGGRQRGPLVDGTIIEGATRRFPTVACSA